MSASGEPAGASTALFMNFPSGAATVGSEYSPIGCARPARNSFSQNWWNGSGPRARPIVPKPWM